MPYPATRVSSTGKGYAIGYSTSPSLCPIQYCHRVWSYAVLSCTTGCAVLILGMVLPVAAVLLAGGAPEVVMGWGGGEGDSQRKVLTVVPGNRSVLSESMFVPGKRRWKASRARGSYYQRDSGTSRYLPRAPYGVSGTELAYAGIVVVPWYLPTDMLCGAQYCASVLSHGTICSTDLPYAVPSTDLLYGPTAGREPDRTIAA
eukprot:1430361-Rhodomonas_salina.3